MAYRWTAWGVTATAIAVGGALAWSLCTEPPTLWHTRRLSGSDCRPRKLLQLDRCDGVDETWQECRFYFRAYGTADRAWCQALAAAQSGPQLPRCDFKDPSAWQRVTCADLAFPADYACYACLMGSGENDKVYVHGYDAACERSIEQVTCNFIQADVARELGAKPLEHDR